MDLIKSSQSLFRSDKSERSKVYFGFFENYQSIHTKKAYEKDLKDFFHFLKEFFPHLDEFKVEHAHVVAYKKVLESQKASIRTINRKISSLGAFYRYLYDLGLIEKLPTDRIRRYKVEKQVETLDLTDEQVKSLLGSVNRSKGSGKLHFALLTFLFQTGMRHSELTGLKFKNMKNQNDFVILEYTSKGGKQMRTPLSKDCLDALGDYLEFCKIEKMSFDEDDYLFRPTRNPKNGDLNKQLDTKSLSYILKKYSLKAGIAGNITPHSARATVIGHLLDQGMSIDRVADFVGHKDISTTKSYHKRKSKLKDSAIFNISYEGPEGQEST